MISLERPRNAIRPPQVGQRDNPNYKFLNLFGAVLDHKLAGERCELGGT
jgi:hypothetical protein